MSATPLWTVWCDAETADDCHRWCGETAMRAPTARANARGLGWHRKGSRDICPACWETGAR